MHEFDSTEVSQVPTLHVDEGAGAVLRDCLKNVEMAAVMKARHEEMAALLKAVGLGTERSD